MSLSVHCLVCSKRGILTHYSPLQEKCAVCGHSPLVPTDGIDSQAPLPEQLLTDAACSYWLRHALTTALERDPVDAANDAEVLAVVLDARCRKLLKEG